MGTSASKLRLDCFGRPKRRPVPRSNSSATNPSLDTSFEEVPIQNFKLHSSHPNQPASQSAQVPTVMAPKAKAKPKAKAQSKAQAAVQPNAIPVKTIQEDAPVSSRTRHAEKKSIEKLEAANDLLALHQGVPLIPPVTGSNITNVVGDFDFDSPLALAEFSDLWEVDLDVPDLDLASSMKAVAAKKKQSGKLLGRLSSSKSSKNEALLAHEGDDLLAQLTLPTPDDYQKGMDGVVVTTASGSTDLKQPQNDQRNIQQFVSEQIGKLQCKCGKPLLPNAAAVMQLARSWLAPKPSTRVIRCQDCNATTCAECHTCGMTARHSCKTGKTTVAAILIIWILLCGLDECVRPDRPNKPEGANSASKGATTKRKRITKSNKTAWASGTGYGGGGNDGWGGSSSDSTDGGPDNMDSDEQERALVKALMQLSKRMPDLLDLEDSTDLVVAMIRNSRLIKALSEYLDNDSLHTISKDTTLYVSMLKIVDSISTTTQARDLLVLDRNVSSANEDLIHYTYATPMALRQAGSSKKGVETCQNSVIPALRRMSSSCTLFEANLESNSKAARDRGVKEMLTVCKLVQGIIARTDMEIDSNGAVTATHEPAKKEEGFAEDWFRANCLLDVPDGTIHESASTKYYHTHLARNNTKPNPGRMKALLAEIVTLKSALPPGIFVRHEVSRLDILKVLIIGPQGTPYENGAFEFDFYCPENYPNGPPAVQFKQTGGGSESMNPNLYPDGKVCLSLLGTWQGEPWRPGKSTLLQVLLSLQSMVFCDEPYYNEPGWSSYKNDSQSKSFNRNLYRATTQVAILYWLEAMEEKHKGKSSAAGKENMWEDVLQRHFSHNADTIMKTLKEWKADVAVGKKEAEEAAKATAAALQATSTGTGTNAGVIPPPPMQNVWNHYGTGKSSLEAMIPRVEAALKNVVIRAKEAGMVDVPPVVNGSQQAIKSPVELAHDDEDDDEEDEDEGSNTKRTRSKRRKTSNKA